MVLIYPRYHCGEEMEYIGKNSQGHGFACNICEIIEYSIDPSKPTTPEETPRKKATEYGSCTKIGQ